MTEIAKMEAILLCTMNNSIYLMQNSKFLNPLNSIYHYFITRQLFFFNNFCVNSIQFFYIANKTEHTPS